MRMPLPDNLPKPTFRKVDDELSRKPSTPVDELSRSFGYRNGEGFDRPPFYIRYTEPLDSDLMKQVEYDMDEQDDDWLQALNTERQHEQLDPVSNEIFEVIMDQLEKEWFTLMKQVPKPDMDLPAEDSCCAVCDDGEGENSNAIVFCDGCNLAVHQDCYGVPYIPEGQWLCRKCTVSPEVPVACMLCPNEGGAFKQTSSGKWAHLLCAIWIPEVTVQNHVFMEPIEHIENISKSRWKLRCSLCKEAKGACIQCDVKSCYAAFHVSCARKQKLLCSMKLMPEQEEQPLRAYCERHLPTDMAEARTNYMKDLEDRAEEIKKIRQSNKAARAYARTYKTGTPLIPQYIVSKVMDYIYRAQIKKKIHVVLSICKYWSLKREARRGAPLLKRLHLEPWTTATAATQQTEDDKLRKLDYLKKLRADLIRLRDLAKLTQDREICKNQRTELVVQSLSAFLFSHEAALRQALDEISSLDDSGSFRVLPSNADAPDYREKITRPRSWNLIREKLDAHEYWDPYEFTTDLQLVWDNAIAYYPMEHELNQLAARLKQMSASRLSSLQSLPILEEATGSLAAFEPTMRAVEILVSETFQEGSEPNLVAALMSSLGDPSRPLVEALIRQGRTSHGAFTDARPGVSPAEGNAIPQTPKGDLETTDKTLSPVVISPPKTTPRARRVPVESSPKRTPLQRKQQDTPVVPSTSLSRRQKVVEVLASPIKSPVTMKKLPPLLPYPAPREHLPDNVVGTIDATPIASNSRKRKRSVCELSTDDLRSMGDSSKALDGKGAPLEGEEQGTAAAANEDPTLSKSQKKTRTQTGREAKEEANRIKREKERARREQRKAQAEAAALRREEQRAAKQASAASATKASPAHVAETNDDEDGAMSSTSSLTDLDNANSDKELEKCVDGTQKRERRTTLPRAKKEAFRRPTRSHQPVPPSRRNSRLTAPAPEKKPIEIPAGFKLQIGPGTKPRPRDEISTSKQKRDAIMGEPPDTDENGRMRAGTYVWAKQDGHPWFPGVIFEPSDESIPAYIQETKEWFCESANLSEEERRTVQIIRFFDNTGTWAWLAPKSIRRLLDNEERDQFFLNGRFRTATLRGHVKQAYARALKQKGHGPPSTAAEDVRMDAPDSQEADAVSNAEKTTSQSPS